MEKFKDWEDLMQNADPELLTAIMEFSSMDKGEMHYRGELNGKKLYCSVSEAEISSYDYSAKEPVSSVTQGCYVYFTIDDEEVLNTH